MKKLYLHIGSPKTGSTSIQEIFAHNRRVLDKKGFIYPGNNPDHHFLYFACEASRNKWPRHFKGMDPNKLEGYVEKYFMILEDDFRKKKDVVMSTEYIFFDNDILVETMIEYLRQFFSKIEIFCFLRNPVDYYKSFQQQLIKGQSYIESPETFKYKFKNVIKTWSPLCDNFEVLKFTKSKNSFLRLCKRMGIDTSQLMRVNHRSKGSISLEQMLVMEKVYKKVYPEYDDQLTGKLHVKALAQLNVPFLTKPKLQKWVKTVIEQNHIEDLKWLERKYGVNHLNEKLVDEEITSVPTFENGKATVRDIYKVPNEESVEKYEALVIDTLLKKLMQKY